MSETEDITFIDFETRSQASLKKLGSRNYAAHPTTGLVCCVLRREDDYEIVTPYTPLGRKGPRLASGSRYVAAHNAVGFDRHIWARLGWPEPKEWIDTSELMRVGGYPKASIEFLGEHVVGIPKDKVGNALTKSLSKVNKRTGTWQTPLTWRILERVIQYCKIDVDIMFEGYESELCTFLHADIAGIEQADRALNDRGVCFDSDLARELLEIDATLVEGVLAKAGVTIKQVRSRPQFIKLMADLGVAIPNCQAPTIEALLDHEDEAVALLAAARLGCSTIAAGKLRCGLLQVSPDGRLRDNVRYYGAHTGRWSGKGMQLQNLPGGPDDDKDPVYAAIEDDAKLIELLFPRGTRP
jgi:DNA polymerase